MLFVGFQSILAQSLKVLTDTETVTLSCFEKLNRSLEVFLKISNLKGNRRLKVAALRPYIKYFTILN